MDRLSTLLQYHEEDAADSFIRFALASEYVKTGDDPQARQWFEALLEHDPDYVGTYFHLGKLYERMDETALALDTYRDGIAASARMADFHARSELQSALLEAEGMGFE